MQISAHAKMRMEERLPNYGLKTRPMKEFKNAIIYGRGVKDFYGEFRNYLSVTASRYEKTNLKVHNGMIWIYEVSKQKLITLWAIPDEFQPHERYLNINKNKYEEELELEKKKRDESKLSEMMLESVLKSRPVNAIRGKGRCTNIELNNYDQRLFEIGYKECRCCGEAKKLEEFSPRPISKDGKAPYCNTCVNNKCKTKRTAIKGTKIAKTVEAKKDMVIPSNEIQSNELFSIASINQVIGFSDKLKEVGLTDKEFVEFIKGFDRVKYDMLLLFNHLSKDSQDLYLKMRGE